MPETAGSLHSDDFHVFFVGDVAAAHGAQMGCLELTVYKSAAMGF